MTVDLCATARVWSNRRRDGTDQSGSSFKVVTPKTTVQQQKLQALPPGHLATIIKGGQTYYVFPDAANNRALVGGPKQYQTYQQYRFQRHLAAEQLATAQAYQDASMNWGGWGGWGGWY